MSVIDDAAVAIAADARQAAYFRAELEEHRQHLLDKVGLRRALIDRRASSYASGLRGQIHDAEAQIRHLERMIAKIDHRYGAQLQVYGTELAP